MLRLVVSCLTDGLTGKATGRGDSVVVEGSLCRFGATVALLTRWPILSVDGYGHVRLAVCRVSVIIQELFSPRRCGRMSTCYERGEVIKGGECVLCMLSGLVALRQSSASCTVMELSGFPRISIYSSHHLFATEVHMSE